MDDCRIGDPAHRDATRRTGREWRLFHGIQLWVNLPRKEKFATPRYQAIEGDQVVLLSSDDGGALLRLIAGDIAEHQGPDATHTPITLAHARSSPAPG